MLAWWALGPLAIAIFIQIKYVYPKAAEAAGASHAGPYIVGTIIGLLLITLLLAWIAYRLSGRSQLLSTLVFSLLIVLLSYQLSKREAVRRGPARQTMLTPPNPPLRHASRLQTLALSHIPVATSTSQRL
jgi:hypothetical protein